MPYIQHQFNGATLCHYELGEQLRIGRHSDNDLVIDDPTVSAHHAVIEKMPYGYQIRDLNSTNGIRIDGKKTALSALEPEQAVVIGTHTVRLVEQLPDSLQHTLKIKKSWIPGVYYTAD